MKTSLILAGPDVPHGPFALLSGTFEERLERAATLGYDGVELMVRDPSTFDWSTVKRALDSVGLSVSQLVTGELFGQDGLCLVTSDETLRRKAKARAQLVVDLAAFLGCMVNIGRLRGQLRFLGHVANPWDLAIDYLRGPILYAGERDVKITIEPINRYETDFVLTAQDGCRLIQDLQCPNAGLMLDLFHMNIEDASIEGGLRLAGERLWHVHIADSHRRYPGSGHLDFDSVFATLLDIGYQDYLSAEILPEPDPDTAAEKTMEFLRRRGLNPRREVRTLRQKQPPACDA